MKQSALTQRQAEILGFIQTRIQHLGFPPTISEIQSQFSFKSPNAVQEHLKALERKGQIRRSPNRWRGLELVTSSSRKDEAVQSTISIPLIGRITAGLPILAEENFDGTISVDHSLVGRSVKLFALHVRGNSMIKAGIYDGDIAVAQQQVTANQGDIIIALLGDEATMKRFHRKNNVITLQPENDAMQPIKISKGSDFKILGKVIATLHRIGNEKVA
jgi:repressor LexA